MLTHRSFLLSLPGPSQIFHKRKKMHLKVLFSFHFPLHLKSLVFLHFSFIPRLACAESDYNILNLQETQSSLKCSLGSPYMCSLALSCKNCCHPRVSSCVQVPLWHTASPPITAKWIQDLPAHRRCFCVQKQGKCLVCQDALPYFSRLSPSLQKDAFSSASLEK